MPPRPSAARSIAARDEASSVTSQVMARLPGPASSAASASRSVRRASSATRAPRWARPMPMHRPNPLDAPTTTVFIGLHLMFVRPYPRRPASPRRSQWQQVRQLAAGDDALAEVGGQAAGGAEELIEDEDPAQIALERVLGGEADAGQHLLAVAGGGAGRAPG